eukprot:80104-Chlamydomonas_euryale.AAC.1
MVLFAMIVIWRQKMCESDCVRKSQCKESRVLYVRRGLEGEHTQSWAGGARGGGVQATEGELGGCA